MAADNLSLNTLFVSIRKRKIPAKIGRAGICESSTDTFGKKWKLFHNFAPRKYDLTSPEIHLKRLRFATV